MNKTDAFIDQIVTRFVPCAQNTSVQTEREELAHRLHRFLELEGQPIKTGNFLRTLTNVVARTYNNSDWCRAKNQLKNRAMQVIVDHFQQSEKVSTLALKADALAEFTLRYLITLKSYEEPETGVPKYISSDEWYQNNLAIVSINELIERAINGNGYHFPPHETKDLIILIQKLVRFLTAHCDELDTVLETGIDIRLSQLEQLKSVSGVAIKQLESYAHHQKGILQTLKLYEKLDPRFYGGSREKLLETYNQLQKKEREVRDISKQWNVIEAGTFEEGISAAAKRALAYFGYFCLKPWIKELEGMTQKYPEPKYGTDPMSASIAIIVYDPGELCGKIKPYHSVLQEHQWLEDLSSNNKKVDQALTEIYQTITSISDDLSKAKEGISQASLA